MIRRTDLITSSKVAAKTSYVGLPEHSVMQVDSFQMMPVFVGSVFNGFVISACAIKPRANAQLLEDARKMVLNALFADPHLFGDLLVGET